MNVKRFASFVLSGKLAASTFAFNAANLPSIAEASEASFQSVSPTTSEVLSTSLHIIELANGSAFEVLDILGSNSGPYGPEVTDAAVINIPGKDCTYTAANKINLVITGLKTGDRAFLAMSYSAGDQSMLDTTHDKISLGGQGLRVLAQFKVEGTSYGSLSDPLNLSDEFEANLSQTSSHVNVQIDLPDLSSAVDSQIYLQVVVFPEGISTWDWANCRVSEVDKIRIVNEDCCTGPYCN